MKHLLILLLLLASVHPISYAVYNAKKKNYFGAAGVILLALAAVAFPAWLIFVRY